MAEADRDHARGLVERNRYLTLATTDGADDPLADVHQLSVVTERDVRVLHVAIGLDVDLVGPIHHDVGDVVPRQQRLQRTETEDIVADVVDQLLLFDRAQNLVLHRDDFADDVGDLLANLC